MDSLGLNQIALHSSDLIKTQTGTSHSFSDKVGVKMCLKNSYPRYDTDANNKNVQL